MVPTEIMAAVHQMDVTHLNGEKVRKRRERDCYSFMQVDILLRIMPSQEERTIFEACNEDMDNYTEEVTLSFYQFIHNLFIQSMSKPISEYDSV